MTKIFKLLYITIVSIALLSCKKLVEVPPPNNQLLNDAVFADSINATTAINGLYIRMVQNRATITSAGLTIYTGLSSDELYVNSGTTEENDFFKNSILPNNNLNWSDIWTYGYNLIYNANACIEGLNGATTLTNSVKNRLLGEAKFVRAYVLFNLVNLYGPVPVITSTNYHQNKLEARASIDLVYNQIVEDLVSSQELLPVNYVANGKIRPNKYTSIALLAKAYLYQKKWAEAESASSQIISSNNYTLETNLNNVFLATSNEAIWKMPPVVNGAGVWDAFYFVASSGVPKYVISNQLINSFEPNDLRFTNWLKKNTVVVSGIPTDYYYPFKYKVRTTSAPTEHHVIFRLAEQYLIRSEARAQQKNISGALSDLNIIRNRAGLTGLLINDQDPMLVAIQHERQVELFCELGNRWFDLKRTDRVNAILSSIKNDWQATDLYYPIPRGELDNNVSLEQNDEYQ